MLEKIKSYINDDELKITILNNKINILNYIDILLLSDTKIIISHDNGNIVIKGESLTVSKLLNSEVLIEGVITMVELR